MKAPFDKYKNIFGKPNEGFHKLHIGGVAVGDTLVTFLLAYLLYYITSVPFTLSLIILLILSMFVHWLFGVKTSVNNYLKII